ncbi:DUF4244 domain-containing protein [Fodinibacter luteus]
MSGTWARGARAVPRVSTWGPGIGATGARVRGWRSVTGATGAWGRGWRSVTGARRVLARARAVGEQGMTTAEYAVGTMAAVAFAGLLLAVVRSGPVKNALSQVIVAALGSGS